MNGKSSNPLLTLGAALRFACVIAPTLALLACGGSKSASSSSSYTIGGTITGLTTGSVVLIYNDSTTLTIPAGASTWVFATAFPSNSSYSVTVLTQPVGELCAVTTGGNGTTLTANVSSVTVACSPYGQWTWKGGLSTVNGSGVYGTLGASSASNLPGARYDSVSWTDAAGNFWLFGGYGYTAGGSVGALNDLWKYSPGTGLWTWVSGSSADNASGIYGTQGTAAAGNVPGSRYSAITWIDSAGNMWLSGGYGYDSTGQLGYLNDLWQFSPGSGLWTWVSGGSTANASGVYGTQGSPAAGNVPGARQAATSWIDSSGNLWLSGGFGYASSSGAAGYLNDLWKYSPSTGLWTWVTGSSGNNAIGIYGTQGIAAAGNVPGARQAASSWTDSAGNLWLVSGYGYPSPSTGSLGYLNDLWQFSPSTGLWTWISGNNDPNASGVYGNQGTASAGNVPGARYSASAWTDSSGNSFLYGGYGYDAAGELGYLSDLWQFNPSSGQWAWISGGNGNDYDGAFGTQGAISASTAPGARQAPNSWIDSSGHLWLFGGVGYGASGNGYLNDLWQFVAP